MDAETRLKTTRIIWIAFFFGMLITNGNALFTGAPLDIWNVILSVMVTVAAIVSTGFVWNWGDLPMAESRESIAKGKRRSRVDLMLDDMDERDLRELRNRLMQAEEQGVPLEVLLEEDGELRQRRG